MSHTLMSVSRQILFTTEPTYALDGWECIVIDQPDDDRRVMAAAQALLTVEEPMVLGGHGLMGRLLPRLGFARRAARRPIEGYYLIDSILPPVAGDWPDAPVAYTATNKEFATHAKVAGERGWKVI
jgi:hypothetical protein